MNRAGIAVTKLPTAADLERVQASRPANPFFSRAYVEGTRPSADSVWVVSEISEDQIQWIAPAFLALRKGLRRLTFPSFDRAEIPADFLAAVCQTLREAGVDELELKSFAAAHANIPRLPAEISRVRRCEYALNLLPEGDGPSYGSNHRRNIRKAAKAEVRFNSSVTAQGLQLHYELQMQSTNRRVRRGESMKLGRSQDLLERLIRTGLARLFQARVGEEVVSSLAIFIGQNGAYYHSAGSSPLGMELGASHALVDHVCSYLRSRGIQRFSLGGVNAENDGLSRFKAGFGAHAVELDNVTLAISNRWIRHMRAIWRPADLIRKVLQPFTTRR